MSKNDPAHVAADKTLLEMERKIRNEYAQAIAEVERKILDYMKRFEVKDKTWRKWVQEGKKTRAEYKQWRIGQMAVGKQWENRKQALVDVYANADKVAYRIINDSLPGIFAENINFATYEVESGLAIDTGYILYDEMTIARIVRDDPRILPPPGRRAKRNIREGKAKAWNNQQIQSVMVQGIIQGKAIPDIAKHLAETVGDSDMKAAIRNARTMTTAAENAGRLAGYYRADNMGIELSKMWMATLDNRTRHSHRAIDGEVVEIEAAFSNGCEYPGDPTGHPAEIYNCRCTMKAQLHGFETDPEDMGLRNDSKLDGMSYDEWKNYKGKPDSDPIDKQVTQSQAWKQYYTNMYRGFF